MTLTCRSDTRFFALAFKETRLSMVVALVTFGKSGKRKEFAIEKSSTVIGRKTDADLRIPLGDISRAHCEFSMNGQSVVIRDLGSSNGTYVNGERVTEATLEPGDRIKLGPVLFTVQIDGQPVDITPESVLKGNRADSDEVTQVSSPSDTDAFDVDDLDDLDIDDLSDLDLDDIDADELEEVDDLEELSEDDLIEG